MLIAYHQIPISKDDSKYTAFETNGKLYQFRRIPFGVTNGVPCFQRFIDTVINSENLEGTLAYLDDVDEHKKNMMLILKDS